jgi:non-ribosomal peptide synthase protein (TIGR01720 family)
VRFDGPPAEHHHNNFCELRELPLVPDPAFLETTVLIVLARHEATRLRFVRDGSGWRQFVAEPGEMAPFSLIDLSALAKEKQASAIETACAGLQASLNLQRGPLLRLALFSLGAQESSRLLTIVHHLATDWFSINVLFKEMWTAYEQLARGEAVRLPERTVTFEHWARQIAEYARSPAVQEELPRWLASSYERIPQVPPPDLGGVNVASSFRRTRASLDSEATDALLHEVPRTHGTRMDIILLTAMAEAFSEWTGRRALYVDVRHHGRTAPIDLDTSLTVGWFVIHCPILLDLQIALDLEDALLRAGEQMRRIPNQGIGYDLLRYVNDDEHIRQNLLPRPRVIFGYHSILPQAGNVPLASAPESAGPPDSPRTIYPYLLDFKGEIERGQLEWTWAYSENVYHRSTIIELNEAFADALRALARLGKSRRSARTL